MNKLFQILDESKGVVDVFGQTAATVWQGIRPIILWLQVPVWGLAAILLVLVTAKTFIGMANMDEDEKVRKIKSFKKSVIWIIGVAGFLSIALGIVVPICDNAFKKGAVSTGTSLMLTNWNLKPQLYNLDLSLGIKPF